MKKALIYSGIAVLMVGVVAVGVVIATAGFIVDEISGTASHV